MHLKTVEIRNFRRLKNVSIDLETDTTIFVGANNSGKTSAASALRLLVKQRGKSLSIFDFSASAIETLKNPESAELDHGPSLPTITLDLWFKVTKDEIHRVVDLLPSLDWDDQPVGLRLEYKARSERELLARYGEAKTVAVERAEASYHPWPRDLHEYLEKKLHSEYELNYSVLEKKDPTLLENVDSSIAHPMANDRSQAAELLDGLITLDFLDAQRFLSDSEANSRTKDLSRSLSHFYQRNLEQFETETSVLQALHASEDSFNKHLAQVFESTLSDLNTLGYPGIENPNLAIRSSFTPSQIMAQDTTLHYSLPSAGADLPGIHLPEKYNGLGFKNLIFMVINILDFHQRWKSQDVRTPVHLVIVEEPEAHLHAQLQQVFIRKIQEKLEDTSGLSTQLVITTHSAHIINESRFTPIRYFRRVQSSVGRHESQVRDVSTLNSLDDDAKNFLERYMKLTHCDLFFADAAILVEGNVERLLLPSIIETSQPSLNSNYLTILEVGGAFAHKFEPLLTLLGLPALVITDLDSVAPQTTNPSEVTASDVEVEPGATDCPEAPTYSAGSACPADFANAVTSNPTLLNWHPKKETIEELLNVSYEDKVLTLGADAPSLVRIAYQSQSTFSWNDNEVTATGRTFEETFAFENIEWVLHEDRRSLSIVPARFKPLAASASEIVKEIHNRVRSSSFKKTDAALELMLSTGEWISPNYIAEALAWLDKVINPASKNTDPSIDSTQVVDA